MVSLHLYRLHEYLLLSNVVLIKYVTICTLDYYSNNEADKRHLDYLSDSLLLGFPPLDPLY